MVGTAFIAAAKAASVMAAKALMPARSNSLFLAGLASLMERCLSSSSTRYSAFGIVKLSRTNFGFFSLLVFSTLEGAVASLTVLLAALAGAASTFLIAALGVTWAGSTLATDIFFAGVLSTRFTAALAGAGVGFGVGVGVTAGTGTAFSLAVAGVGVTVSLGVCSAVALDSVFDMVVPSLI